MTSIYTDATHFRNETQTQIKFLGNLPLNKYRKGIAERHGFKSIKSFEDDLDLITIWVVAYETLGSSGGFNWFYKEKDAVLSFSNEIKRAIVHQTQIALFPFKINKNTPFDDICETIEDGDYSGQMDKSDIGYPFPKSIWKDVIKEYNATGDVPETLSDNQYKILSDLELSSTVYFQHVKLNENNKNVDDATVEAFVNYESKFKSSHKFSLQNKIHNSIVDNVINVLSKY
jgi:hypothetical protein